MNSSINTTNKDKKEQMCKFFGNGYPCLNIIKDNSCSYFHEEDVKQAWGIKQY